MASASILDLPPGLKEKVFSKSRCKYYYLFLQNLEKCPSEQNLNKVNPTLSEKVILLHGSIAGPTKSLVVLRKNFKQKET